MEPIIFLYRSGYLPAFPFKPGIVRYDIEKALENRYRSHQRKIKLIAWVKSLASFEWLLRHRYQTPLHSRPKPVAVHVRKRR